MTETTPDRPLTPTSAPVATAAENFAWWAFGTATFVAGASAVAYVAQLNDYRGEPAVALGWFTLGLTLMGLTLVPGLILTGMRQLLDRKAQSSS